MSTDSLQHIYLKELRIQNPETLIQLLVNISNTRHIKSNNIFLMIPSNLLERTFGTFPGYLQLHTPTPPEPL